MTATDTQRDTAVALVRGGMPRAHAAKLVGVTHTTVGRWVEEEGVDLQHEVGGPAEIWYTPPGLAALTTFAVLRKLSRVGKRPLRVLCPAAGAGVYARAVHAFEPAAHIVAVEPRREEVDNLSTFCAEVIHGAIKGAGADDLAESEGCQVVDPEAMWSSSPAYDLVIDNPPFTWLTGTRTGRSVQGAGRHLALRPLLRRGGLLAFLAPSSYGQAINHQPAMREWSPAYQFRVTGRPQFSGDNDGGKAEISMWVWSTSSPPEWRGSQLPHHPSWLRWAGPRPGTFPIPGSIVDAVREAMR